MEGKHSLQKSEEAGRAENLIRQSEPDRGISEKRINELNLQMREVVALLDDYLLPIHEGGPYTRLGGLQKFTKNELRSFCKKTRFIMDHYFETTQQIYDLLSQQSERFKDIFTSALTAHRQSRESYFRSLFMEARENTHPDPELKMMLDRLSFDLAGDPSEEQIGLLRQNFPTGNYLLHTTHIRHVLRAILDNTLLSAEELSRREGVRFDFGGGAGIRFNMNDVAVLTGDHRHLAGFVISPEAALSKNRNCALTIPPGCAEYEVALVPKTLEAEKSEEHFERAGRNVPGKDLPKIPMEQVYIFCSDRDSENFKIVLASLGLRPKGIFYYPFQLLRVESWTDTIPGDHIVATKTLKSFFAKAGIVPTINWKKDLFAKPPLVYGRRVRHEDIKESFRIIASGDTITIEK